MTLSNALRSATSSLASHSSQLASISRNISGVGDSTYVRREAQVFTDQYSITRVEVSRLCKSSGLLQHAKLAVRCRNGVCLCDRCRQYCVPCKTQEALHFHPQAFWQGFRSRLNWQPQRRLTQRPSHRWWSRHAALAMLSTPRIRRFLTKRKQADKAISNSVDNINSLLSQIKEINDVIVVAAKGGKDDLDSMDVRDQLVSELAAEIGIKVHGRRR